MPPSEPIRQDQVEPEFHPVTADRWPDLETLFGPKGAYSGCWCMWWRLRRTEFDRQKGADRKRGLKSIVDSGEVPGIIAYVDGEPAGWCSVAPRERFEGLERSRTLKRVDEEPVWSVVCFFVGKPFRGRGLMPDLLRAAAGYAADRGARIVEGYPVEAEGRVPGGSKAYRGIASVFREAGFVEVARPSDDQPIMRYSVRSDER